MSIETSGIRWKHKWTSETSSPILSQCVKVLNILCMFDYSNLNISVHVHCVSKKRCVYSHNRGLKVRQQTWSYTATLCSMFTTTATAVWLCCSQRTSTCKTQSQTTQNQTITYINKYLQLTIAILSISEWWWHSDDTSFSHTRSQKALIHTSNQPANPNIRVVRAHTCVAAARDEEREVTY